MTLGLEERYLISLIDKSKNVTSIGIRFGHRSQ